MSISGEVISKRIYRLLIGILLPYPVGIVLDITLGAIMTANLSALTGFPLLIPAFIIGYRFIGLQLILYSVLMEFLVWRIFGVNYKAILVSALLGALCGLSLLFVPIDRIKFQAGELIIEGFITGIICGLVLYRLKREKIVASSIQ